MSEKLKLSFAYHELRRFLAQKQHVASQMD